MLTDIIQNVHGLLLNRLPAKYTRTAGGWVSFNCPVCAERRKRAGIITTNTKISYNCFNCGFKTGWDMQTRLGSRYKKLASILGASDAEIQAVMFSLIKNAAALQTDVDYQEKHQLCKFKPVNLPENTCLLEDLPDQHPVKQYAIQRGIYGVYPLLHFDEPLYKKRLVIPFTYQGEVVGWSGRHIAPANKQTPKYLSNSQPGYVFNTDQISDQSKILIVVEGIVDAIRVSGVSVLSNTINTAQAELINKLNKRVIVCADRDKAGRVLVEQSLELGWEVSFPPWYSGCKDAAQAVERYGRLATVNSIITHATKNITKANVKMRMNKQ
jgi:predicted RNA-binding Zn-ribbon protein involved in translation (DUF1610 family)